MTILLSLFLLQDGNGIRLHEGGGPQLPEQEQAELAVVVFDVQIAANGSLIRTDLIQGRPEYVERSRLALKDWRFIGVDPKFAPVRASVVFLYRPRHEFPDKPMVFDQPLPQQHRSPFPVRLVDPGYPLGARGEGSVIVQVATNVRGKVEKLEVVSSVPTLSEAAAAAVRNWEFDLPGISIVVAVFRSPKYK